MTTLPNRVLNALDRFNAAHPWDHNAHYHRWILRQLPRHFGRALDVGAGSGDLARLLATRADEVQAIDADPAITARARESTPASAPVTFTVADARTRLPRGPTTSSPASRSSTICRSSRHLSASGGSWLTEARWWSSGAHGHRPSATICWEPSPRR